MSIAYVYTGIVGGRRSLSAWFEGEQVAVPGDHRFYERIVEALHNGDGQKAIELSNLGKGIVDYIRKDADGNTLPITIVGGKVFYKDRPVDNFVCERIIEFMIEERSPEPLILFLERLLLNPSSHSVKQLYKFLEANNIALTERGTILAWKRVRSDFYDMHSGTILNEPGSFVEIPRNEVDDDYSNECSYGLHVGSFNFVKDFKNNGEDGHVLLLEVDPQDVVSVPKYDSTKMRVCKYFVIKEVLGDEFRHFSEILYKTDGTPVPVPESVPYTEPMTVTLTDENEDEFEEKGDFEFEEEDEDEEDNDFDGEIDEDEDEDDQYIEDNYYAHDDY